MCIVLELADEPRTHSLHFMSWAERLKGHDSIKKLLLGLESENSLLKNITLIRKSILYSFWKDTHRP